MTPKIVSEQREIEDREASGFFSNLNLKAGCSLSEKVFAQRFPARAAKCGLTLKKTRDPEHWVVSYFDFFHAETRRRREWRDEMLDGFLCDLCVRNGQIRLLQ